MRKLSLLLCVFLLAQISKAQEITNGLWFNEEKDAKVQFFYAGNKLNGKIVWLANPSENGKPRTDAQNPDAKLRNKPMMGMVFLRNFEKIADGKWEDGQVYDPRNGKTYSGNISLKNPREISLRGYIGISLLGRNAKMTRAD